MAKFLLGILTGILLTFFMAVFVVALIASLSPGQPSIQMDSILTMRLRGDIPEHAASEFSIQWLRHGPPPTLLDLRNALKEAADDERISALVLESGGLGTGWAKAQEIRYGIENFKKSGKPVIALLNNAGTIDYFVSSSADEIFMVPEAILDMKGLRAEVSFYADTLEKLGIEAEVERIGKYKSAAEPFSRSSMSDEYREVVNSVLDDLYTRFIGSEVAGKARRRLPRLAGRGAVSFIRRRRGRTHRRVEVRRSVQRLRQGKAGTRGVAGSYVLGLPEAFGERHRLRRR